MESTEFAEFVASIALESTEFAEFVASIALATSLLALLSSFSLSPAGVSWGLGAREAIAGATASADFEAVVSAMRLSPANRGNALSPFLSMGLGWADFGVLKIEAMPGAGFELEPKALMPGFAPVPSFDDGLSMLGKGLELPAPKILGNDLALFAASAMASSTFEQSAFALRLASASSSPNFVAGKSSSALKIASGVDIFVDSSSSPASSSDWNEKNGETAPTFVVSSQASSISESRSFSALTSESSAGMAWCVGAS